MVKKFAFVILLFFLSNSPLTAETRAYLLDVYDHVAKNQWEIRTGFAPDTYINSHGGINRVTVLVKATWMCYGNTAHFILPCKMPKAKKPLFKIGDTVNVTLEKHITKGWEGKVVLSLYRADLKSNVYGIRFKGPRKLYNRYFEFNLKKGSSSSTHLPLYSATIAK